MSVETSGTSGVTQVADAEPAVPDPQANYFALLVEQTRHFRRIAEALEKIAGDVETLRQLHASRR